MPSSYQINYSLRPNKNIQRQIIFEGIRELKNQLGINFSVYVGFGSIWFTDFVMAHKILDINKMISMEAHKVVYKRALFNRPYAMIDVKLGQSWDILPCAYEDKEINQRPWVIWLDYDGILREDSVDDIRRAMENVPDDSIFLATFNAAGRGYGKSPSRPQRLRSLFGDVAPDDLSKESCNENSMQTTLADLATNFMKAKAIGAGRPAGFVPAFRIIYQDSSPMVTVGGVLPSSKQNSDKVEIRLSDADWKCQPERPIVSPILTVREALTLQSELPRAELLTREDIRQLGFDLEEDQIEAYHKYYREYPAFAQIFI